MNLRAKLSAVAVGAALAVGGLAIAASPAHASTETCSTCVHVQSDYAFRGALDALHQATAVNSPVGLWYENPTTTDPGADFLGVPVGTVTQSLITSDDATVNDSSLNWYPYVGDSVIRLKYDPYGDGGANTYLGLNGTRLALRNDNPQSRWQEFIEVPVDTATGVPDGCTASVFADFGNCSSGNDGATNTAGVKNACGDITGSSNTASDIVDSCVLIDVGQTQDVSDPLVITDPQNAFTGSLVQQDVEYSIINQGGAYATNQIWDFEN